jgi:hypothetical protein
LHEAVSTPDIQPAGVFDPRVLWFEHRRSEWADRVERNLAILERQIAAGEADDRCMVEFARETRNRLAVS